MKMILIILVYFDALGLKQGPIRALVDANQTHVLMKSWPIVRIPKLLITTPTIFLWFCP